MKRIYKGGKALAKEITQTDMAEGTVAIWHLGQSGVVIKGKSSDGALIIDPYLTDSIERKNPETEFKRDFAPPVAPEQLEGISVALVTHFHDDHLDVPTLEGLDTQVVVPASHQSLLSGNTIPVKDEAKISLDGFSVTPVIVRHTEYENDAKGNPFYFGYFIEVNGVKLFHSGDTVIDEKIVRKATTFSPDIAFLPINGGDYARTRRGIIGNMSFRAACDFAVEIGTDMLIPIHYDLFPNNRDNPSYFVDYLFHTYPAQKFHMMIPGERFIYHK